MTTTLGKPKASLLTDLERIIHSKDGLEREIADLRTQREDLRRFLDIDVEKAELNALRTERATILAEARDEASRIVEAAHAQAEKVAADGRTTLDALTAAERASASRRADEVTAEALRAATAMRESAERTLDAARKEAARIVADAESRIAEATAAEQRAHVAQTSLEGDRRSIATEAAAFASRVTEVRKWIGPLRAAILGLE